MPQEILAAFFQNCIDYMKEIVYTNIAKLIE